MTPSRALRRLALTLIAVAAGCGRAPVNDWPIRNAPVGPGPVLCFGDSLVAGEGASDPGRSYPRQLQRVLDRPVRIVGTRGQTARQGLDMVLKSPGLRAPIVVVTLGGNDILRQIPLEETVEALELLFTELQRRGCVVAFTAVEGLRSRRRARAYADLCRRTHVVLVPDVLDGILGNPELMDDPIHPNDEGCRRMARRVANTLVETLRM